MRELRELVRYRMKLVQLRSGLKAQVHAVMAKEGVLPTRTNMFGPGGQAQMDEMQLGDCYRLRIDSLRDLIDSFDDEVGALEDLIHDVLTDHAGYRAIQEIDGWVARSRRSSWLRSVTSPGSPVPGSCAHGPG